MVIAESTQDILNTYYHGNTYRIDVGLLIAGKILALA